MAIFNTNRSVSDLNNYIELTQDVENEDDVEITVDMSTVRYLKKMRRLEIEYFNKCDGSGAAFILLNRVLRSSPLETWSSLGPELISLIEYWLEAVRKHLISHHIHWWTFLKHLLGFIKQIRLKDASLSNALVEQTAESLLDLATSGSVDHIQRYEILHTLNLYCAQSSRDVRLVLQERFNHYFVRLSAILATCGHAPSQLAALETLLRWLVARRDLAARRRAAATWLPPHLYTEEAVRVFVKRTWLNFFEDSRDFLNCHNKSNDLVVSAICRNLTVGEIVVVSGTEPRDLWMDVNTGDGSVSVSLEPAVLAALGEPLAVSCDTLTVPRHAASAATLHREPSGVVLSLTTLEPPLVVPSGARVFGAGGCDVTAALSSRVDLPRLDAALRTVFQDKYRVLLDVNTPLPLSPRAQRSLDEKSISSRAEKPRIRAGFVQSERCNVWKSPSSASTSSLAQLHFKLAALPKYNFAHEPVSVIAQPALSIVSEQNESEILNCESNSTLKLLFNNKLNIENRGTQSDGEAKYQETHDRNKTVQNKEIEHLPKDNELSSDNLAELLVQEALQSKANDNALIVNSGVKTTQEIDFIEDTQYSGIKTRQKESKPVSKSTSNESNTESIKENLNYVSVRKRNQRKVPVKKSETKDTENATFDAQKIEDFFSQHFAQNKIGDVIISPTLAKKINETSSESSEECPIVDNDFNYDNEKSPDLEIADCLNNIVDKVCQEFEKCSEYLDRACPEADILEMAVNMNLEQKNSDPLQDINTGNPEIIKDVNTKPTKTTRAKLKHIKLKFPDKQKAPKKKTKTELKLELTSKMSTIVEENDAKKTSQSNAKKDCTNNVSAQPLTRKKRKLYSPKDDEINLDESKISEIEISVPCRVLETSKDENADALNELKKDTMITPKSAATCYKDIERDRQKYKRTVNRKSKTVYDPQSPKSRKLNEVFNKLKDSVGGDQNITYIDKKSDKDAAIFNFTSDSEDEDFKQKKIEIRNRTSTTTIGSGTSLISTRRGRVVNKVNYSEDDKSALQKTKKKNVRRKKVTKRTSTRIKELNVKADTSLLVDERMRSSVAEDLNTSLVTVNVDNDVIYAKPIIQVPQIEYLPGEHANIDVETKKKNPAVKKHEKKHNIQPLEIIKDGERTESPLPGLVIENEVKRNDGEESLIENVEQKFQKMFREGPDAFNDLNTSQNVSFDNDMLNSPHTNVTKELDRKIEKRNTALKTSENYDTDVNTIDNTMNSEHERKGSKVGSANSFQSKRTMLRFISKEVTTKDVSENKSKPHVKKVSQECKKKSTDSAIVTRSKLAKCQSNEKDIEIIDIKSSVTANGSDKSIDTVGITAHGDMTESPPRSKLLNEKMTPRELHDMDQNLKDFYIELNSKLNVSKSSAETNHSVEEDNSVAYKALENKKRNIIDEIDYDLAILCPSLRNSQSECSSRISEKSPTVSLKQLTPADIAKWLPTSKSPGSSVKKTSEIDRFKLRPGRSPIESSVKKSSKTKRFIHKSSESPLKASVDKSIETNRIKLGPSSKIQSTRKSQISPIEVDDFIPRDMPLNQDNSAPTYVTDSSKKCQPKTAFKPINPSSSTSGRLVDTSPRTVKRRIHVAKEVDAKKSKLHLANEPVEVGASTQSSIVDDWMRNTSASCREANEDVGIEFLQNVLEKLETTLAEIHENTAKGIISFMVEVKSQLLKRSEERRRRSRETADSIKTDIAQMIDNKFAKMDLQAEECEAPFLAWMKQRAVEVLKKDCKKKHAMVLLLKEDVEAVIEHTREHSN